MAGKQTYDAENIAVLEGLEAVDQGEMLGTVFSDPNKYAREILSLAEKVAKDVPLETNDPYIWIQHQLYRKIIE